ncbi:hypothetical protein ACJX0J_032532, partial [Zea mays]
MAIYIGWVGGGGGGGGGSPAVLKGVYDRFCWDCKKNKGEDRNLSTLSMIFFYFHFYSASKISIPQVLIFFLKIYDPQIYMMQSYIYMFDVTMFDFQTYLKLGVNVLGNATKHYIQDSLLY